MAKESNSQEGATKGPADAAGAPGKAIVTPIKTPGASKAEPRAQEIDGKIVRKDPPMAGPTSPISEDTVAFAPPQRAEGSMSSAEKPAPAPEKAASTLGDYKLLKKLGQGGMGAVYKAHHVGQNRVVALKVLSKELASKGNFIQRFHREARAMQKLDHPNVLTCFDVGEAKGFHYLAMEVVDGGSVEGWLKKLGRFPLGDAMHIILKTCLAMQHAHENAVIHRDIKPDNILLTRDGIIKVADLGLAKDTDEDVSLTKTGAGAGTPIYMAPEQARDVKHVDVRVDIYAIGVMLYVLLTGQPPFQGTTLVELIAAKEKGKFDPMRKYNDDVPSKLDLIVDKMIAKDPKFRFASCQEVIDELEGLGLANDELSFFGLEDTIPAKGNAAKPTPTKIPVKQAAATQMPGKQAAKTSVPGKGVGAKTTAPKQAMAETKVAEEEESEHGVWYWNMITPEGKKITKKLTTEQIRALIKAGHLDQEAEVSKTMKSGFRPAATFNDFQGAFKVREATLKVNVKGKSTKDKFKELEAAYDKQKKWGWFSRTFGKLGSLIFGLLWITLILGIVGGGGYFIYVYFIQ